jgi:hypothetical protein
MGLFTKAFDVLAVDAGQQGHPAVRQLPSGGGEILAGGFHVDLFQQRTELREGDAMTHQQTHQGPQQVAQCRLQGGAGLCWSGWLVWHGWVRPGVLMVETSGIGV